MADVSPDANRALIDLLWAKFAPVIEERLDAIEALVVAIESDQAPSGEVTDGARYASHNLAGSLGSYGRPAGSVIAREIQHLIDARSFRADKLRELLQQLRSVLDES